DNYNYLLGFKGTIGSLFNELITHFTTINTRIDEFFTMIKPYIDYFYTADENKHDTFIHDVILGTKDEIDGYIDIFMKYISEDNKTNTIVEKAIENTLQLSHSVEMILDAVEAIDLYAKNTMIISIKAGLEGTTLTTIAQEMSHLADIVNAVSDEFQQVIWNLHSLRNQFSENCDSINVIIENYLTQLKLKIHNSISNIIQHQKMLSRNVISVVGFADQLKESIQKILLEFQTEDIVRQDIEKILFAIEAIEESIDGDDDDMVFLWGALQKLISLQQDFLNLYACAQNGLTTMSSNVEEIEHKYNRVYGDVFDGEDFAVEKVYQSLEHIQKEAIDYINDILMRKTKLLEISKDVVLQLQKFDVFFAKVQDIVKKFDVVNMLTRIELARHATLQKTIASSLTDISVLPKKIKKIVEDSENLYKEVITKMETTYKTYEEAMNVQDRILKNCVNNLKTVSIKLYESKKYYIDISQQIDRNIHTLKNFLTSKTQQLAAFKDIGDNLQYLKETLSTIKDFDTVPDSTILEHVINAIVQNYGNEYKGLMLVSLLKEYSKEKADKTVIVF
ncbi:MAG: hypothetical protein ACUVRK_10235, partial [Spirochaetota bacterium]